MSFEKHSKAIYSAITKIETASDGYRVVNDVESLRNIIHNLVHFVGEMEHSFSYCVDYHEDRIKECRAMEDKMYMVLDHANYVVESAFEPNTVRLTYDQFRLLYMKSEDEKYEETYGINLVDTMLHESGDFVKYYIFEIIDQKKWNYTKIKYEF